MVLGKLPVPGRPTIWITVGQGPTALTVGAGGGCLDIFTLLYPSSPLSPSLWETARYRLKYCLKGPLNPNQPTNQMPHNLIKDKLVDLIERTFQREGSLYIACNDKNAFFTSDAVRNYNFWSCQKVCEALTFLLDNIYIRFGSK